MANIPWLADVLRAEGVRVVEHGDWRNYYRPGSFSPIGVLWHHTAASTSSPGNPHPGLSVVINGRPDLPGPLAQALVDYNGVFHVISAGRCNHAGRSRGSGPIPPGDGNTMLVGWEIDYNGVSQEMSRAQYDASVKATAAVLRRIGRDAQHARGHKETSTTGKIDPAFVDLDRMRSDVADRLAGRTGQVSGQAFVFGAAQHVAAVSAGGSLTNFSWSPATGVVRADWGGAELAPGDPVGFVHAGLQHVFARGTDDTLRHWYQGGGGTPGLDSWDTGGRVMSNPTGFPYGNQQHVFYRNPDGRLEHRFYDTVADRVSGDVWPGGPFTGDPHAFAHNHQQHVFARDSNGDLVHWWWEPGRGVRYDDWGVTGIVASDPTGFSYRGRQHHVFFRNTSGRLEHRFFDDASGRLAGGVWPGGAFTGNPHAMVHGSQQHIFARTDAGDLAHWYWIPGSDTAIDNWGAVGVVAGDPVGLSVPGQHHVFYRTNDGSLAHRFVNDSDGRRGNDNWGGDIASLLIAE